jgi:hypothetical protein
MGKVLARVDDIDADITDLDARIEAAICPFPDHVERGTDATNGVSMTAD